MRPARSPREINGINLDNYFANHHSYNSVVYVHKKFLEQPKKETKAEKEKKVKESKEKKAKKKVKSNQCDKCQQFNNDLVTNEGYHDMLALNSAMLGQTLQFAKTVVPIVIPPSGIVSPIYYNIKATKKSKKKTKPDISFHTFKKEKSKKIVETYRNEKGSQKESFSVKETISYSSQCDTLDELNINPSLCCTFSDASENKHIKREKPMKHKQQELQKLAASESFEALAAEFLNTSGDTKIKIHLMNETEKSLLAENIRGPILNAIREGIIELNNQLHNNEVSTVQKFVKSNTQKLENIMEKLSCIEQKLEKCFVKEKVKTSPKSPRTNVRKPKSPQLNLHNPKSPRTVQVAKASTLEQLGEDLLELDEQSTEDEYFPPKLSAMRKARGKSEVVQLNLEKPEKKEGTGGGEDTAEHGASPVRLVKPDRPNRLPARFCWTEAGGKKNPA